MRSNGSIQVQDPSASPTFALSRNTLVPVSDVPPTLRRNLFGAHLSRRPTTASTERIPDPFQPLNVPEEQQLDVYQEPPRNHQAVPNIYETRRTPSRSQSPVKSQSHSNASIIAVDPKTGRPQLPKMPDIPDRMPEGDEDELEQAEEDAEDEVPADDDSELYVHKRYPTYNSTQEPEISSSSIGLAAEGVRFYELIDQSAGHIDLSKVQSILSEMQSQQKARARTIVLPPDPILSATQGASTNGGVSARTRGKAKATPKPQIENYRLRESVSKPRLGGIGATLDSTDKEELLSAIMAGLSKRVHEAEENAWMFGDERININGLSAPGGYSFGTQDELDVGY